MSQPLSILLCRDRTQRPEQEALIAALTAALTQRPQCDVVVLPHLVDLAPNGPGMQLARSISGPMVVLAWLYPRAAFWVLDAHGVRGRMGETATATADAPATGGATAGTATTGRVAGTATTGRGFTEGRVDRPIWCMDLRRDARAEPYLAEVERIAAGVLAPDAAVSGRGGQPRVVDETTRPRWYPVVDRDACANCLECLNFCLFGVYSLDGGDAIAVEQPDACRNGCPACSRICPHGAILFPQHKDPAIAGGPQAAGQGIEPDLGQLFGGSPPAQLAAAERDRAVAQRSEELDRLVDQVDEFDP